MKKRLLKAVLICTLISTSLLSCTKEDNKDVESNNKMIGEWCIEKVELIKDGENLDEEAIIDLIAPDDREYGENTLKTLRNQYKYTITSNSKISVLIKDLYNDNIEVNGTYTFNNNTLDCNFDISPLELEEDKETFYKTQKLTFDGTYIIITMPYGLNQIKSFLKKI